MDCYLVEGLKVFYRVALTILHMHKKHSSKYIILDVFNCSQRKFVAIILVLSVFLRFEEEYWLRFEEEYWFSLGLYRN